MTLIFFSKKILIKTFLHKLWCNWNFF